MFEKHVRPGESSEEILFGEDFVVAYDPEDEDSMRLISGSL